MAESKDKIKVKVSHRYNVSAEKVFDTFLDPTKARKFMFATLTGKMIKAELDARVGGGFVFVDRRPEGDAAHYGRYLKLDKPSHIAFEFGMSKELRESDLVTLDISPLKQGCEVLLTHEMKSEYAHLKDRVAQGWDGILDGLGAELRTR